jgi:hypothetical protein
MRGQRRRYQALGLRVVILSLLPFARLRQDSASAWLDFQGRVESAYNVMRVMDG